MYIYIWVIHLFHNLRILWGFLPVRLRGKGGGVIKELRESTGAKISIGGAWLGK